jgi:protein-L-isoaspartate O-methyltransferase
MLLANFIYSQTLKIRVLQAMKSVMRCVFVTEAMSRHGRKKQVAPSKLW